MKILLVEPFYGGSHQVWAQGLSRIPGLDVDLLTLPARWWKWRMSGGAVALARRLEILERPDLVLASSMLDLPTFQALTRDRLAGVPHLVYFHENQFAYPDNGEEAERKNLHYCFLNYLSALSADGVAFNSRYNRDTFLEGAKRMLASFPDYRGMDTLEEIKKKSVVLPLGFDFQEINSGASSPSADGGRPVLLWNHRWEHDKNPGEFFDALRSVRKKEIPFRLVVCGESYDTVPDSFTEAKKDFVAETLHFGFAEDRKKYLSLLCRCDFAPVTSRQDFFGISIVEAAWAGAIPLLPARLSYPEIFPEKNFSEIYYRAGSLDDLLEKRLTNREEDDALREKIRKRLWRYDWSNVSGKYLSWFEQFV